MCSLLFFSILQLIRMNDLHFRDVFGLIFLAVTNAFTVNKKKLLIYITDKGEETFF